MTAVKSCFCRFRLLLLLTANSLLVLMIFWRCGGALYAQTNPS